MPAAPSCLGQLKKKHDSLKKKTIVVPHWNVAETECCFVMFVNVEMSCDKQSDDRTQ